jgi:hypothetical protein
MARRIPNDIVDVIVSKAIDSAHYQQAARLALVNKNAYAAYKERVDVARSIVKDIVIHTPTSSDSFKVSMKVLQGNKIAFEFNINKLLSIKDRAANQTAMFNTRNPRVFYELLDKMVCTTNMRDVRVKTRCARRDVETIMPYVTRFIKYITAKCVRA